MIKCEEVASTSRDQFGLSIGDHVTAGQVLATISGTSMLHFEMYRLGTWVNARWRPGQARPPSLYNTTLYPLDLAALGAGATPAASPTS